jgi:hypothetical protein
MEENMNVVCCTNCFNSASLRELIETKGDLGNCDFCSSKNLKCVEVDRLSDSFEEIFSLYREIEYGFDYFEDDDPHEHGDFLFKLVDQDWYWIFSDKFDENKKEIFWKNLSSKGHYDKDDPPRDSLALYKWDEGPYKESWFRFSDYLMRNKRFTITDESVKEFVEFLPDLVNSIETEIPSGTFFYRARLGPEEGFDPYPKNEMGAPPPEKTTEGGRANPPGIPFLYLSDKKMVQLLKSGLGKEQKYLLANLFQKENYV